MRRVAGSVRVDRPGLNGQSHVERPPVAALAGLVSSVWIQQVAPDAEPYDGRAGGRDMTPGSEGMPPLPDDVRAPQAYA
jgi:hypothetical protein